MNNQPFIRGEPPKSIYPLQTCLPAYRSQVISTWLKQLSSSKGIILCPFGSSPQVVLEAARSGFQILTPVHNPILRFLIESLAKPPNFIPIRNRLPSVRRENICRFLYMV